MRAPGFYLRPHTPVALVPGVAHLDPSGAPFSHISEIRTPSSEQSTLSVPLTTWKVAAGPGSPFCPGGPGGPRGPSAPAGPTLPRSPGGPCRPSGPITPCGPGGPTCPGGPILPSSQAASDNKAATTETLKNFPIGAAQCRCSCAQLDVPMVLSDSAEAAGATGLHSGFGPGGPPEIGRPRQQPFTSYARPAACRGK
jgi:hypothetical protein